MSESNNTNFFNSNFGFPIEGDGNTRDFVIRHNMSAGRCIIIQVMDEITGQTVNVDVQRVSKTNVIISFMPAPDINSKYRVLLANPSIRPDA